MFRRHPMRSDPGEQAPALRPARSIPRTGLARLVREAGAPPAPLVSVASTLAEGPIEIDHDLCIGCGTCEENEAHVFRLDDRLGKAFVVSQEGDERGIRDAIDACPVACISGR